MTYMSVKEQMTMPKLTRNKYDDAYVMGYHNGYHAVKYDNQYVLD